MPYKFLKPKCSTKIRASALFEKKFTFQQPPDETWSLPKVDQLYKELYKIDEFYQLKLKLNEVKSRLNEYNIKNWSKHTRRQDPAGNIPNQLRNEIKAELVTVAWCKFYEILSSYPIVTNSELNSLHLCEAPGAFIAALNHYLHTHYTSTEKQLKWNWKATTLNPYHESNPSRSMITDDRLILRTLNHWLFHSDFTGNLLSSNNITHMQNICAEKFDKGVHLITADGSVDCMEVPEIQEEHVGQLHFAEIISALLILAPGGSFVIKLFTFFEASTICILYLLSCAFNQLHVFKPATSKRGNSEVYVICLDYKPETEQLREILLELKTKIDQPQILPIFARVHLPPLFLQQLKECAENLMNWQINAIESNIYAYTHPAMQHVYQLRRQVCWEYFDRYDLKPIDAENKLLPQIPPDIKQNQAQRASIFQSYSYNERQKLSMLGLEERLYEYSGLLNELIKTWCNIPNDAVIVEKEFESVDIDITCGQEVIVLQSSMFVVSDILLLSEKFETIFHNSFWRLPKPHCDIIGNDMNNLELKVSTLADLGGTSHEFFQQIIENIYEQKPHTLVFHNVPLLTHFGVSVLFLLAHNHFGVLEFDQQDANDIKITLRGGKDMEKLQTLTTHCSNGNVLCLVNITHLHENEFHDAILNNNNIIFLRNCEIITQNV